MLSSSTDLFAFFSQLLYAIPAMLLALTVHEWAHGYSAYKLGDPTAKLQGRLTLNPGAHIDPVGTLLVPSITLLLGGLFFGWAKPVPVNARYFKNPERDMAIVAFAGPLSNFVMMILWALILGFALFTDAGQSFGQYAPLDAIAKAGVQVNLIFCVLNLLPLPPLDGSKMILPLLPDRSKLPYLSLERYGIFILLFLALSGMLSLLWLSPVGSLLQPFATWSSLIWR